MAKLTGPGPVFAFEWLMAKRRWQACAIAGMIGGNRWGRELGAVVNGLQVGAGLLLLSVSAATSLAESASGAASTC